ncbi:MAG: SoxR reducing system RseC family protein [Woeseiaceae bacterium]
METVTGKVAALRGRKASVLVKSAAVCHRCAAGKGCGAGIFQAGDKPRYMQIEIPDGMSVRPGDRIDLQIGARHLLRAALLAYGLPLITTLITLLVLQYSGFGARDAIGIVAAGGGLLGGLAMGRAFLRRESICDQFVPTIRSPADDPAD